MWAGLRLIQEGIPPHYCDFAPLESKTSIGIHPTLSASACDQAIRGNFRHYSKRGVRIFFHIPNFAFLTSCGPHLVAGVSAMAGRRRGGVCGTACFSDCSVSSTTALRAVRHMSDICQALCLKSISVLTPTKKTSPCASLEPTANVTYRHCEGARFSELTHRTRRCKRSARAF